MLLEHLLKNFDKDLVFGVNNLVIGVIKAHLLDNVNGCIVNAAMLARLFVAGLLNGVDVEPVF